MEAAGSAGLASSSLLTFKHKKGVGARTWLLDSEPLGYGWEEEKSIKSICVHEAQTTLNTWHAAMVDNLLEFVDISC